MGESFDVLARASGGDWSKTVFGCTTRNGVRDGARSARRFSRRFEPCCLAWDGSRGSPPAGASAHTHRTAVVRVVEHRRAHVRGRRFTSPRREASALSRDRPEEITAQISPRAELLTEALEWETWQTRGRTTRSPPSTRPASSCRSSTRSRRCKAGATSLGIRATNGVVLATEKKLPSTLVDETTVEKIAQLTPEIGITYSGMGPDFRVLTRKARKETQVYYRTYHELVPCSQLVRETATVMQEFTQRGGVRPFGVSPLCRLRLQRAAAVPGGPQRELLARGRRARSART